MSFGAGGAANPRNDQAKRPWHQAAAPVERTHSNTHRLEGVPRLVGGVVAFLRGVGGLRASALMAAAVVAAATSRLALVVELGMMMAFGGRRRGKEGEEGRGCVIVVLYWLVV
jgi:hypothetical protein